MARFPSKERGFALLVTLLSIVLLGLLVFEFGYGSRVYLFQAMNRLDQVKAFYLAKSGINWGREVLFSDMRKSSYDGLDEDWAVEIMGLPLGEGSLSVKVIDEGGKFNINTLVKNNGNVDENALERFKRLLSELGLRGELADEAVELLKSKEDAQYNINELSQVLEVKGVSLTELKQLKEFITLNSEGLVNINTAPKEVIASLSDSLTSGLVDEIVKYREETPFKSKSEVKDVPGVDDKILATFFDVIDIKSSYFAVFANATVNGITSGIEVLLVRKGNKVNTLSWREV